MKRLLLILTLLISTNSFADQITGISSFELLPSLTVQGETVADCQLKMSELINTFNTVGRKAIPKNVCKANINTKKWATGVLIIIK